MREPDVARLEALAARIGTTGPLRMTEMPGGASTRRYFRVELDAAPHTAVAMFVPEGAKPEELGKAVVTERTWPFLEVRDLLASAGVDVPALYADDQRNGWLLIEDLGDDTLANVLLRSDDEARVRLYRSAVVDLAKAQRALMTLPADSIVATRAFDADLLRWEIEHFREWGLEARGHILSAEDRATFEAVATRLAERIASWPKGFVHRDYQSRNLMVRKNGSLTWIDFQDALLGPRVYDLVALLNDSYQTFSRPFVEARLHEYAEVMKIDENVLVEQFDYVTVQRKLKDAGRFVFIHRTKGNEAFMRFVVPTVAKVGESLERLASRDPGMLALKNVLQRALPEELR